MNDACLVLHMLLRSEIVFNGPGIESRWGEKFSKPDQTGPGAHPASYTMRIGSLYWV